MNNSLVELHLTEFEKRRQDTYCENNMQHTLGPEPKPEPQNLSAQGDRRVAYRPKNPIEARKRVQQWGRPAVHSGSNSVVYQSMGPMFDDSRTEQC